MTAPTAPAVPRGQWLTAERIRLYAAGLLLGQVLAMLMLQLLDPQHTGGSNLPGNDFRVFWAASRLGLEGHGTSAYDIAKLFPVEQSVAPLSLAAPWHHWFYPPTFLLAVLPLALVPYKVSFILFVCAGIAAYLAVLRKIVPLRGAVLPALAFPAVIIASFTGQNSLLTASLAGLGLILLDRRPRLAGVAIGLLVIKPHLALLFVLALACGRRWTTLVAAAGTAGAVALASVLVFSPDAAVAFVDGVRLAKSFADHGMLPLKKMPTVFAGARLLGLSSHTANLLHALVAATAALAVARLWWRGAAPHLRNSALIVGCMLISPHLFDYDLVWLAWPIAWLASHGMRAGWQRGEQGLLLLAWVSPLACDTLAHVATQAWPVVGLLLLAHLVRCARLEARTAAGTKAPVLPGASALAADPVHQEAT